MTYGRNVAWCTDTCRNVIAVDRLGGTRRRSRLSPLFVEKHAGDIDFSVILNFWSVAKGEFNELGCIGDMLITAPTERVVKAWT